MAMKSTMLTVVLAAWCLFHDPPLLLRASGAKIDIDTGKMALYVFGDSLYDTGMTLYHESKTIGAAKFWPYGETYFKKPAGRFCDGRVIPDFIAQSAGLPLPEPYLRPGLKTYTNGINFASASACVLVGVRPAAIDFTAQVEYFREMVQKMKQQMGQEKANNVISQAVYLFDIIGGNDYVQLLKDNINKTISPAFKELYMREILGNISIHLKTIYNEGGRKFAFQNLGPLGCQPHVRFTLKDKGLCVKELQDMLVLHNAEFSKLMQQLESQLPEFKYSVYDFYSSAYQRFLNGQKFGFKETQIACCGSGDFHGDFTCEKKDENFTVCSNPSDHLWFDAGHTTEAANRQFSEEFWGGSSNLVAPYNIKALFAMH